jgi:hypothetical protein
VKSGSGSEALISSTINWTGITGGASNFGAGLLYGFAAANGSPVTQIAQIGNGVASGSQLPFIDAETGVLSYVKREATDQEVPVDRVIGFTEDGTLVATNSFIPFSITTNQITCNTGLYYSSGGNGISLLTNPSDVLRIINLGANTTTVTYGAFTNFKITIGSKVNSIDGSIQTETANYSIFAREFGTNWIGYKSLSIPSNGIFIGPGPSGSTVTTSEGMRVSNDTTANALVFTNYNLSANASITTRKDRSSRIGLGVLNVDIVASNAYANMKNTAYITHTYVPSLTTIVDEFTVTDNTKKSYKYLIHCENAAGEVFTSELLLLVKMVSGTQTTNLVQYGSIGTSAGFSLSFAFAVSGSGPYTGTLTHNGTSGGVAVKLLKYEV